MIAENVGHIRHRMARACSRAGRKPENVCLIAVAKTFPAEAIQEVVTAGIRDIGENYVQELLAKREALPDPEIRWHFVGHLQSNKVKNIVSWVHAIHTIDSARLGEQVSKRAGENNHRTDILVEVNTSGESTKFGVTPDEAVPLAKSLLELPNVRLLGLMTIGPLQPDPEASRPAFRRLRLLGDALKEQGIPLEHLSMGMTNDFEVAIEEGATMIRIGTAIFGKRTKRP